MADYFTHFSCLNRRRHPRQGRPSARAGSTNCALRIRTLTTRRSRASTSRARTRPRAAPSGSMTTEHGDAEAVIRFVLRLAEELDLTGLWGFQYALTCSRPRLDAFGGGAHVIDLGARKSIGWTSSQEWLAAALKRGRNADALSSSAPPSTSSPNSRKPPRRKARSWYRELGPHDDWWDAVYEDFERVCDILGHPPEDHARPPDGRRHAGQGLHMVFRILEPRGWGLLRGLLVPRQGRGRAHADYAPTDATLHSTADRLQAIQRRNF